MKIKSTNRVSVCDEIGCLSNGSPCVSVRAILCSAWALYGELMASARKERRWNRDAFLFTVFMNVFATLLVVSRVQLKIWSVEGMTDVVSKEVMFPSAFAMKAWKPECDCGYLCSVPINSMLHFLVSFIPILSAVLLVIRNKLFGRSKYTALKTAAELTKRSIFEFRARSGVYSSQKFAVSAPKLQQRPNF